MKLYSGTAGDELVNDRAGRRFYLNSMKFLQRK